MNKLFENAIKRSENTLKNYGVKQYSQQNSHKKENTKRDENFITFRVNLFEMLTIKEFEGEEVGGIPNGRGKQFFTNNWNFEGEFNNGKKSGFGVLRNEKNEAIFSGEFSNDFMNGRGAIVNISAENFDGKINFTNFNDAVCFWKSYEGEFKDNLFNGMGTLIFKNGEKYSGNFENGNIHGDGHFYANNEEIKMGVWNCSQLVQTL